MNKEKDILNQLIVPWTLIYIVDDLDYWEKQLHNIT